VRWTALLSVLLDLHLPGRHQSSLDPDQRLGHMGHVIDKHDEMLEKFLPMFVARDDGREQHSEFLRFHEEIDIIGD
jgi:hypothetical protein